MSSSTKHKITYPKSEGFFDGLMLRVKLILRLMGDSRVSPTLKLLPIASMIYLIVPLDIPGPIDDALVIWLASYFFIELCPPDVVQEHLEALKATRKVMETYQETAQSDEGEVIDGEVIGGDADSK